MSFSEVFKSGFLQNISGVSLPEMAIALMLALGVGLFIFLVYKKTYSGVMYSSSFGVTLIALTMISTLVILAVTSNVVLSLGMVGALSIVRFRTAIKDPLDIAFLFWAIAAGIVLAAGLVPLAVIGSCLIGIVLMVFVNRRSHARPYMMVIRAENHDGEVRALKCLEKNVKRMAVKGKSVSRGDVEMNIEIRLLSENTDFVNEISELEGVKSCVMVTYNGEYMG